MIEIVNTGTLRAHPKNPRSGDIGAIIESIKANGFYGAIVARRMPDGLGQVLAGNHRLEAARQLGLGSLPVFWVEDCDDDRALRILLADNRTNDLASYDDLALSDLLADLAATADGLSGTGYDGDDLDELISDLKDFEPEPAKTCPKCGAEI